MFGNNDFIIKEMDINPENLEQYEQWNFEFSNIITNCKSLNKKFMDLLGKQLTANALLPGLSYIPATIFASTNSIKRSVNSVFESYFSNQYQNMDKYDYWSLLLLYNEGRINLNNMEVLRPQDKELLKKYKKLLMEGGTICKDIYSLFKMYWVLDIGMAHKIYRVIQQSGIYNSTGYITKAEGEPVGLGIENYTNVVYFNSVPVAIIKWVPFFGRLRELFKGSGSALAKWADDLNKTNRGGQ